jgi:CelD/BcsL family acetyltransferase involved in cellulose biosynthesis
MTTRVEVLESVSALQEWRTRWDRLAASCGQPLQLSPWTLAWWEHRRPREGGLRAVAVIDRDDELVGFGPWFIDRTRRRRPEYRLIGARGFFRIGPLASPGQEREVARSMAVALAGREPAAARVRFEGISATSPWPALIAAEWPGSAPASLDHDRAATQSAPTLALSHPDFDSWFADKSANFRRQMRVRRRAMDERGGAIRLARDRAELRIGIQALIRIHHARWQARGGSGVLDPSTEKVLLEASDQLLEDGSIRLFSLHVDDRIVAGYLCAAVGGEVVPYLIGFDPDWASMSPGVLVVLAAIEDAFARGDRRFDFGPGAEHYKLRFADRDEPLGWFTAVPGNRADIGARLWLTAEHVYSRAARLMRRLPRRLRHPLR